MFYCEVYVCIIIQVNIDILKFCQEKIIIKYYLLTEK